MTEIQVYEKWLSEYFAARHKTWRLRNDAQNTPSGKRYCREKMFQLTRKTIAHIRHLRRTL